MQEDLSILAISRYFATIWFLAAFATIIWPPGAAWPISLCILPLAQVDCENVLKITEGLIMTKFALACDIVATQKAIEKIKMMQK